MSVIRKLSIRGVRSYGTENNDEQTIEFETPLTLILGDNGCGKTTILECLKYGLTGEMPPGSVKGQSFVHDPKIFHSAECLGQVKLQVKTIKNDLITIVRSMKLSITSRGALKFGTLDATISGERDGKREMISKRCVDTTAEMSLAMGVSAAIINDVLFCHQEDADWPLADGKKLKDKFDAIFDTTKYTRAVDKFIRVKKEKEKEAKDKEGELKLLDHYKRETEKKTLDMEDLERKSAKLQEDIKNYDEEIKPISDRLLKLREIEMELSKCQTVKVELETKLSQSKEHQKRLTDKIQTIYTGTTEDLEREIREFEDVMETKRDAIASLETELKSIKLKVKKLNDSISALSSKRDSLVNKREQEQNLVSKRVTIVTNLCKTLDIPIESEVENDITNQIERFLTEIKEKITGETKKIAEKTKEFDQVDADNQTAIDRIRERRAAIESDIKSKRQQMAERKSELSKLTNEILKIEKSAQNLKKVSSQIEEVEKMQQKMSETINLEELRTNITEKRATRAELQVEMEKFDKQLQFLNSIAAQTNEIKMKERQLEERETEAKRVKSKHSDNLRSLFGAKEIATDYRKQVRAVLTDSQRVVSDLTKKLSANQKETTKLQLTRKSERDRLNKMETDKKDGEERIYENCMSGEFTDVLERVRQTMERHQLDLGANRSAEALYKKYLKKIEEQPSCPLCHTDITEAGVSKLSAELNDEICRLPETIKRSEMLLKNETKKYENLLALRPIKDKLARLETEIPKCKENLKSIEEKLAGVVTDTESLEVSIVEPKANVDLATSMLGDMSLLDEANKDVIRLTKEIADKQAKIPAHEIELTVEQCQAECNRYKTDFRKADRELDELQQKLDKESESMNKLRDKLTSLKDERVRLQEGIQALEQMKQRQTEIGELIKGLSEDMTKLVSSLEPLKIEQQEAIERKNSEQKVNRRQISDLQKALNEIIRTNNEIESTTKELDKLMELNLPQEIERIGELIEKGRDDLKIKTDEFDICSKNLADRKEEIAGQESSKRDLLDNRDLQRLQSEQIEHQKKLDDVNANMGDLNFKSVTNERNKLIKQHDEIVKSRSELIGETGQLKSQIGRVKRELAQDKYKNAIRNYRHTYYDVVVRQKIAADLGKYRVALEWALMKYHSEKMENINRLIRDYWRAIYRGNDIDYIQIKTNASTDTDANKKRSYDYRIVQYKNDVEVEFKGRCSAGQRVLACLIIRMALAETFSCNCGVLALDEPTTNLDRKNIESLCESLNLLIQQREMQSSFMLLVITHDEGFVKLLGGVDHYYRVERSIEGKSIIRKQISD